MRKKVLLDVDGVLAAFHVKALAEINDKYGTKLDINTFPSWHITEGMPPKMQQEVHDSWRTEGWCLGIPVFESSVMAVQKLREVADVYFLTAQMIDSPYWMWERTQWLKQHFQAQDADIIFTLSKQMVMGDVLVDDKPENIQHWSEAHPTKTALLWDQSYNRHFDYPLRVSLWEEVQASCLSS